MANVLRPRKVLSNKGCTRQVGEPAATPFDIIGKHVEPLWHAAPGNERERIAVVCEIERCQVTARGSYVIGAPHMNAYGGVCSHLGPKRGNLLSRLPVQLKV